MTLLRSPDGRDYRATNPTEATRLLSRGYTAVGSPVEPAYDPGAHNVADVLDYIADHPEQAEAVEQAERAGKGRKAIIGE